MRRPPLILMALLAFAIVAGGWMVIFSMQGHSSRSELPVLGQIPAFSLTAEDGRVFRSSDWAGNVVIVDFIFTRCGDVCPRITAAMKAIQGRLLEGEPVRLLSISVDPEHDTPEQLAAYAKGFGADPRRWRFVTGPAKDVENAVVAGFKVPMGRDPEKFDNFSVLHSDRFVLVDAQGAIRGYYESDPAGLDKLLADARSLNGRPPSPLSPAAQPSR